MSTDQIHIPPFQTEVMDNGLTVVMMPIDKMPLVSVKCLIKAGTSADKKGKTGSASLTLELLKKGSGDYNAAKFSEAIDFLGGTVNTGSAPDYSIISADFLQKDLATALQFMGGMVMKPHFLDHEFDSAQQRISAAIKGIMDNPSSLNSYFFQKLFFGESHPYASPANGILQEIDSLQSQDIREFFNEHFIANNAVLVLAGKFKIPDTMTTIQKIFSPWGTGQLHKTSRILIPVQQKNKFFVMDRPDSVQTYIQMGVPGIYQNHPDSIPLNVINSLFGGGFTSRLNQEIRVKRGLTYSISSGFTRMFHQGSFAIGTFTKTESTGEVVQVIFDELHKLHDEKPRDDEIRDTIRHLCGTYPLSLETAEQLSEKLTRMALYELPSTWISDYLSILQALSMSDILKVVDDYFPVSGYTCVLSGNGREIESQIQGFGEITVMPNEDIHL